MLASVHNPFTQRGPIRDAAAFVGRATTLAQVLAFVGSGQCVSLVGPRRIGKTSLALHCARAGVLQHYGIDPQACVWLIQTCETWEQLTSEAIYQLLANLIREQLPAADRPVHAELTPYRQFEQAVRELSLRQIQLVLVLDEFDLLSRNPALDEQFFTSLRGLVTAYGLSFFTISTRPLLDLTFVQGSTLSSPFFNVFAQVRLGLFAANEVGLLFDQYTSRAGLQLSATLRTVISQLSGPHPLLLQIAAFYAVEALAAGGEPATDFAELFLGEARQHWSYWWQMLSPADQRLLALLPLDGPHDRRGVTRLIQAGLVQTIAATNVPLSVAFAAFVREQPIPGLLCAPPLLLEPQRNLVLANDQIIALTASEGALLACLLDPPGCFRSFAELDQALDGAQPSDGALSPDRVKAAIKTLRAKLGMHGAMIENVRGGGFRLVGY
ncbi:MAG: AAA family ATPase [Oscillochloridaceae bacterium umkhey_bin13]